jgi:hypothetical protein
VQDPDRAAYYLWAADHDPGSVDGAVGYVLHAQEKHDIRVIRQLLQGALTKEG